MRQFDRATGKTTLCVDNYCDGVSERKVQSDHFVAGSERYMEGNLCIHKQ